MTLDLLLNFINNTIEPLDAYVPKRSYKTTDFRGYWRSDLQSQREQLQHDQRSDAIEKRRQKTIDLFKENRGDFVEVLSKGINAVREMVQHFEEPSVVKTVQEATRAVRNAGWAAWKEVKGNPAVYSEIRDKFVAFVNEQGARCQEAIDKMKHVKAPSVALSSSSSSSAAAAAAAVAASSAASIAVTAAAVAAAASSVASSAAAAAAASSSAAAAAAASSSAAAAASAASSAAAAAAAVPPLSMAQALILQAKKYKK